MTQHTETAMAVRFTGIVPLGVRAARIASRTNPVPEPGLHLLRAT